MDRNDTLIGMTDYVLEQEKEFNRGNLGFKEFTNNVCNYANFLKQPLELSMFVPCDGKKCLFDDFIYDEEIEVVRNNYGIEIYLGDENLTIDDLTKLNLKLTK